MDAAAQPDRGRRSTVEHLQVIEDKARMVYDFLMNGVTTGRCDLMACAGEAAEVANEAALGGLHLIERKARRLEHELLDGVMTGKRDYGAWATLAADIATAAAHGIDLDRADAVAGGRGRGPRG